MTTVNWNVSCTLVCPNCGEEEYLEAARTNDICAHSDGIEIHESEILADSDGKDLVRDDLISWLCTECDAVSGIEIHASWGTVYTLREPKEHIVAEVDFSSNFVPANVLVGVTKFRVKAVEKHEPLYGMEDNMLFSRPPYGVWAMRFACGRGCIEIRPARKNLDEIEGDLLEVFVIGLDNWASEAFTSADQSDALREKTWGDLVKIMETGKSLPDGFLASAAFSIVIGAEASARQIVWQRLRNMSGNTTVNWWKGFFSTDLVNKLMARAQDADDAKFERHQPVDFLTTAELKSLVSEKWQKVFSSCGVSQEKLNGSFVRFESYRNQVAHGRSLTYKDYLQTVDAAEELGKLLHQFTTT